MRHKLENTKIRQTEAYVFQVVFSKDLVEFLHFIFTRPLNGNSTVHGQFPSDDKKKSRRYTKPHAFVTGLKRCDIKVSTLT